MKRLRHILLLVSMLLAGVLWGDVWASNVEQSCEQPNAEHHAAEDAMVEAAEEAELDVVGLIFDHISDAYSWHIATYKGHHIEIPLLCIVRSEEGKWYSFLSSKVSHGHTYKGFYVAPKGAEWEGKLVAVGKSGEVYRPIDLSITKNAAGVMIKTR